jgi:hypothetical protein
MIKISILKDGQLTNGGEFETQELADAWLAKHEGLGTFGQKAGTREIQVEVAPAVINEDGTELVPALYETQIEEVPGYVVVIEDITAKLEQEKANAEAQAFLDGTDWQVLRHRDQQELGLATSLTSQEFNELLQQRQAAREAIIKE